MSSPRAADEETRRAVALASEHAERRTRSLRAVVAVGLVCLVTMASAAVLEALRLTPGLLTPARVIPISAASWALFALASALYLRCGRAHPAYRIAAVADEGARSVALMSLLVLAGPLAGFFLLASLARGLAGHAMPASQKRRTWGVGAVAHLSVSAACLLVHRPGSAMLVVLALCAYLLVYGMTVNAQERVIRVRVERDLLERALLGTEVGNIRGRIARELHDGLGADVMSVVLQLRREATRDPEAAALAQEAQHILEDLRSVVWSLKGEQGTFGELAKLLDAKCARLCAPVSYQRLTLCEDAHRPVPTSTALTALQATPELVRLAARQVGATRLQVSLGAGAGLELWVDAEGAGPGAEAAAFEATRGSLAESQGALTAEPLDGRSGTRWRLSLPLA